MRRTTVGVLAAMLVLAVTGCAVDGDPDAGADGTGSPEPLASSQSPSSPPATPEPTVPKGDPISPRPQPPRPSPLPSHEVPPRSTGEAPRDYLDAVVADAAQRAGVSRSGVQVERDQSVQWRDGSLGCPEPGMMYTQAIVDGYWVEVTAAGQLYDYRVDGQGNFRLCEQPLRSPPHLPSR